MYTAKVTSISDSILVAISFQVVMLHIYVGYALGVWNIRLIGHNIIGKVLSGRVKKIILLQTFHNSNVYIRKVTILFIYILYAFEDSVYRHTELTIPINICVC